MKIFAATRSAKQRSADPRWRQAYVIVRLFGGLGNQLFSYATGRAVASRSGAELLIDAVSGFARDRDYRREYLLDRFDIQARRAPDSDCFPGFRGRLRRECLRRWNQRRPIHHRSYLRERDFMPELLSFRVRHKAWLEGYWQDPRYFIDAEPILRKEFRLSVPLSDTDRRVESEILSGPSIGVHIRTFREAPKAHGPQATLPPAYYEVAVQQALLEDPDARVYCFSDNLDWTRSNIRLPGRVKYVSHNLELGNAGAPLDLWLLSRCHHLVLSSSTFSWWAAWLATQPGKTWISANHWWPNTISLSKTLVRVWP